MTWLLLWSHVSVHAPAGSQRCIFCHWTSFTKSFLTRLNVMWLSECRPHNFIPPKRRFGKAEPSSTNLSERSFEAVDAMYFVNLGVMAYKPNACDDRLCCVTDSTCVKGCARWVTMGGVDAMSFHVIYRLCCIKWLACQRAVSLQDFTIDIASPTPIHRARPL